jgi:hypothetical protein
MLLVFAVSLWDDARLKIVRHLVKFLVIFSLSVHIGEFRHSMHNLAYGDQWPQWTTEVQRWRTIPGYRPRIWPPGCDLWLEK